MLTEYKNICGHKAIICGAPSDRAFLFIHGKCGSSEEARLFAETACPMGYTVIGVDLPGHDERKSELTDFNPWHVVPELKETIDSLKKQYKSISVRANSIVAYFAMLALGDENIKKALFVSPILDMEKLILGMMSMANVSESELRERGTIHVDFGDDLSWQYLTYVREHRLDGWHTPTAILYGGRDNLTAKQTVDDFVSKHDCSLTVADTCEHWFHTPEQLNVLAEWEKRELL